MKHIVKWIVPLLLAAVAAGCGTERRSALEAYRSWPKGLSVSLTMPAEKLQQVKEVIIRAAGKAVDLPFGRAWDISSPDDSLRVVHFENSVNAINTLA